MGFWYGSPRALECRQDAAMFASMPPASPSPSPTRSPNPTQPNPIHPHAPQARTRFLRTVAAARAVQAAFRGWRARRYVKDIRQHRAALVIQSQWRRHTAQAAFQRYRRGVVAAQVGGGWVRGVRGRAGASCVHGNRERVSECVCACVLEGGSVRRGLGQRPGPACGCQGSLSRDIAVSHQRQMHPTGMAS